MAARSERRERAQLTDRRAPTVAEQRAEPRLFVAVPLPEAAVAAVRDLVERVQGEVEANAREPRSAVRWVRLDGLHLTLRFIGPTPRQRVAIIATAVDTAAAGTSPVDVAIGGAGAFPSPARPRTLWLGVTDGAPALDALAGRLNRALGDAVGAADDRPFRPHLTLGRADGRREGPLVARRLTAHAADFEVRFRADRIVLFESITGGGPARYVPLHEALLGG
jgi:2'-5' RNA ligase